MKRIFVFSALLFTVISFSVRAEKDKLPEKYFSGKELSIARLIHSGKLSEIGSIASKTDLNKFGNEDMTLLFYSVGAAKSLETDRLLIITQLVKAGADPLQNVPDMGSVAEIVATSPHAEFMRALIDGGMDVNAKVQGQPLLHDAASDDTLKTLALMVNRGADVNATDSLGKSTVMAALDGMQLDTVEWLLNHGANPNSVEKNTGWSFMRQLNDVIKRNNGDKGATHDKLMMILNLAQQKGGRA